MGGLEHTQEVEPGEGQMVSAILDPTHGGRAHISREPGSSRVGATHNSCLLAAVGIVTQTTEQQWQLGLGHCLSSHGSTHDSSPLLPNHSGRVSKTDNTGHGRVAHMTPTFHSILSLPL